MGYPHGHILIIGAGPAGLGAARALQHRGREDFLVVERNGFPGGLSRSIRDKNGYLWDIGTHVHFRRQIEYQGIMEAALGGASGWRALPRAAWIWTHGQLIPYPLQLNLKYLPLSVRERCVHGLLELKGACAPRRAPSNLKEWISSVYGNAIAAEFLVPYCRKALSYEPSDMSVSWAPMRFPSGDTARCLSDVVSECAVDAADMQSAFVYPASGGNGAVWRWLADQLQERIVYSKSVVHLESASHTVLFSDGTAARYDKLISTMPLDQLIINSDFEELKILAEELRYATVLVIGFGLRCAMPPDLRDIGWIYCAEPEVPFYRMTVQSNLSRQNVPDPPRYWSLMVEISLKPDRIPSTEVLIQATLDGISTMGISIRAEDIVDTWVHRANYAYPIPSIGRESVVCRLLEELHKHEVYSCGRFGSWHYENSNQDDCFAEGASAANLIAL